MDTLIIIILVIFIAMILLVGYSGYLKNTTYSGGHKRGKTKLKNLVESPRSKSEAYVVKILEEITGLEFPTAFPQWLVDDKNTVLELDGYNEKAKIALEFSGPIHTKWYPAKETYAMYLKRVKRDMLKIELCKKNGVSLVIIDAALPRIHTRAYLKSRLYDIGWITEKPFDYILEQKIEPYRNPGME